MQAFLLRIAVAVLTFLIGLAATKVAGLVLPEKAAAQMSPAKVTVVQPASRENNPRK